MARLTKKQLSEQVTITCYRNTEKMKRSNALKYYRQGIMCCDPGSSECERYTTIYFQLLDGRMHCSDGC